MDINHFPGKFLRRFIQFEKSGQTDNIYGRVLQNGIDCLITSGVIGRLPVFFCLAQAQCIPDIGDNHLYAGMKAPFFNTFVEIIQSPAASG